MVIPEITQGSIEHIVIDINDQLQELNDIETAGLKYDVKDRHGADVVGMQQLDGIAVGMQARLLIDSTGLTEGTYKLFINFNALPEEPRLGPFYFTVNAD